MTEVVKALFDRLRADKRTTWIAALAAFVYGGGKGLSEAGFEPWGTGVSSLGVVLAVGALAFTAFSPPKKGADVIELDAHREDPPPPAP